MNQIQKEVLEIVENLPGITRAEIVSLMPHVGKASVYWALSHLKTGGDLVVGQKPSPNKAGPRQIESYTVNPNPKPAPKVFPIAPSSELAELRAFKAMALERYPDLGVDPIVLEARGIVASMVDAKLAEDVRAGRKDDCPIMRATLEALSRRAA